MKNKIIFFVAGFVGAWVFVIVFIIMLLYWEERERNEEYKKVSTETLASQQTLATWALRDTAGQPLSLEGDSLYIIRTINNLYFERELNTLLGLYQSLAKSGKPVRLLFASNEQVPLQDTKISSLVRQQVPSTAQARLRLPYSSQHGTYFVRRKRLHAYSSDTSADWNAPEVHQFIDNILAKK